MPTSTPTFTNNPQAKNDLFTGTGLTEDSLSGVKLLDVMGNDLGTGSTLYSLADAKGESESLAKALLTQDAVGAVNQSTLGARIWITADGKVAYDASAINKAQFQSLAAGQSATDSFTYAIKLSNGLLSWATAKVQIAGINDAPVIDLSSLTIDGDSSSGKVSGTLLYTDPDKGDQHGATTTLSPLVSSTGAPNLSASLGQALRTTINDEGENGKGALKWNFALPSGTPKLAAGQAVLANYQLSIADNHGGNSAPQNIGFLVVGTGSTPKVYSVASRSNLTEQTGKTGSTALNQASGTLSGNELGLEDKGALTTALVMTSWSGGAAIPSATATVLAGAITTSTVPTSKGGESEKSIAWQFSAQDGTFDFLAAGETLTLAYRISSSKEEDGKSKIVTLTVTGTNDAPVITNTAAALLGAVKEDTTLSATGQLSASDVDHGATQTWSVQGSATGTYGAITVDAGGKWTYALDNAAHQNLAAGESHDETFVVRVTDDQGAFVDQSVTVTVTGTNDAPFGTATAVLAAGTEDTAYTVSAANLLAGFSDVDTGDTLSVSGLTTSNGTISANGNGTFTITPTANFNGAVALGYNVVDGQGGSVAATQGYTLAAVNDAPVAHSDVNTLTVTSLASQARTNVVNWVDWTSSTAGTVTGTINLGNGQTIGVTYSGEFAFAQTNGGTDYYTAPNGTSPYTSSAVANRPTGSDIIALSQATQKTLTFSQPVDNLFFAVVSLNGNGYLFDQDFQIVSYGTGYWGSGSASKVVLADGRYEVVGSGELHGVLGINGSVQSLTWTSQSPEYWNGFTVGTYGKALTATAAGNVLTNDSDPESDALSVTAVNGQSIAGNSITLDLASGARIKVGKDGSYLYDENSAFGSLGQNQTTTDSFQYTVSDGHGGLSVATTTITITGVNDAPTGAATATLTAGTEDTAYTVSAANLLAGFSDVDTGDTLSVSGLSASNGAVVTNTNGTFTITPTANFNGAVTLNYNVVDGHGGTVAATQTYKLAAVNDVAVITDDVSTIQDKSVVEAGTGVVGDPNASGKLLITDVDTGEAKFQVPNTVIGTYGDFTFNANTGAWTYKLRDADANVQALKTGQTVTDTLHVVSFDGTAGNDVIVGIAGSNDSVDVIGTTTLTFTNVSGAIGIYGGFNFTATDSYYYSLPDWYGTGSQAYNGYAGRYSDMVTATGADFSVDKLDIREYSGAKEVDIKGFNNGVELYNKHIVLTTTMQTVALDYVNIDDLQIVVTTGSANNGLYGWWLIDNIMVA